MKKLIALLTALLMALGCVGALAEQEVFTPQATECTFALALGEDFVKNMLPMTGMQADEKTVDAILSLISGTSLNVVTNDSAAKISLLANSQPVASLSGAVDAEGVTLVSNLFPNYAVRITFEELAQLVQLSGVTVNGQSLSQEQMQEIAQKAGEVLQALTPYLQDVTAFIGQLSNSAQMSEDNSTAVITLTKEQVAGLAETLLTRLKGDETMQGYVQLLVDQINAQQAEDQKITLEALLAQLDAMVAQLKADEDQELAAVAMSMQEDGSMLLNVNVKDTLLVNVETGAATTVVNLAAKQPIEDAEALLNALMDGSNTTDTAVIITNEGEVTDIAVYAQGMNADVHSESSVTGQGTADFVATELCTISVPQLGGNVVTLAFQVNYADAPEAPALDNLTAIDLLAATEEEQNAFAQDLMSYGLPAVLGGFSQAMPEEVAAVMALVQQLSAVEGPTEESTETVPAGN